MSDGRLRVACIVANEAYEAAQAGYGPLHTVPDARELDELLRKKGFQVIMMIDATRSDMQSLANKVLLQNLRGKPDSVVLIYYAGHAVVKDGYTFLVPIDVNGDDPGSYMSLFDLIRPVHDLVGGSANAMARAGEAASAAPAERSCVNVFLDACRTEPPATATGPWPHASITASSRSHVINSEVTIAYACDDGKKASDHGHFTRALIESATEQPGQSLADWWVSCRQKCLQKSQGRQRPWIYDSSRSMTRVLLPAEAVEAEPRPAAAAATPPSAPRGSRGCCEGGGASSPAAEELRQIRRCRKHFAKAAGKQMLNLAVEYADLHPEVEIAQCQLREPDHFVALYDSQAQKWLFFTDEGQLEDSDFDLASMMEMLQEE